MKTLLLTTLLFKTLFADLTSFFQFQKGLNSTDAQDLASEVLIKAERTFDEGRNTTFKTHTRNVSRSMLVDFFRNKKAEFHNSMSSINMEDDEENEYFQIADTSLNAEETQMNDDSFLPLRNAINTVLNSRQKLIVEEHYFNGFKVGEIAQKQNINPNTVKLNLVRSRKLLFKALS